MTATHPARVGGRRCRDARIFRLSECRDLPAGWVPEGEVGGRGGDGASAAGRVRETAQGWAVTYEANGRCASRGMPSDGRVRDAVEGRTVTHPATPAPAEVGWLSRERHRSDDRCRVAAAGRRHGRQR